MTARVTVTTLGDLHALLGTMSALVDNGLTSPRVMQWAHQIVSTLPPLDQDAAANAIFGFMQRAWRYVPNPIGPNGQQAQRLRDADNLLRQYECEGIMSGECASAAILGASLAKAIGIEPVFRVVFFDPSEATEDHVFTRLCTDTGNCYDLDVTPKPAGGIPTPTSIEDFPA
jgi:hypothetical protein